MGLFNPEPAKPSTPATPSGAASIFTTMNAQSPFNVEKLADKFRYRDLGWTIPQAYLALLFLAADSDGKFNPEERSEIETVARRSPALRFLMERNELGPHEQAALAKIAQNKDTALEEAAMTLPDDMCLSVFAHCVDLMLADGDFAKPEQDFIDTLYRKLQITEDYARRILEVLLLKGRY